MRVHLPLIPPSIRAVAIAAPAALLLATGCGAGGGESTPPGESLPQGSEPVRLSASDFTLRIDNRYWPMAPGSRWVYRETDGEGNVQRGVTTVTSRTKQIADGVKARVVHDVVYEGGRAIEVTDDWYAQDSRGNVWYLGERTAEYENGRVASRAGSWEAGVDGAQPGVIVPARPRAGLSYRQEHYAGEAEDDARVLSTDEQAEVPFGHFAGVLLTRETTPLEPRVVEYKLYAPGIGPVLTLGVSGESGREELVDFTRGAQ